MMKFAILIVNSKESKIVLEKDERWIKRKLLEKVQRFLPAQKRYKRKWKLSEIDSALNAAFKEVVKEFKEETIKIT